MVNISSNVTGATAKAVRDLIPEVRTKTGTLITRSYDAATNEIKTVVDFSKQNKAASKMGLWRVVKRRDADTNAINQLRVGLHYDSPLELGDFVVLGGDPKVAKEHFKEAHKLAEKGNKPRTIVAYMKALLDK